MLAEAVEELLKKAYPPVVGECSQIAELPNY